ncbi:hypothetical protein LO55_883 [Massilia timonae]|uniref:Uncharacterized protein n=1 Tax=Massilia timonae TaxID=47229 RepID=A0A1S2N969_9BURK|nr:hypothetical protein LO55_883 [Massilia timonae]
MNRILDLQRLDYSLVSDGVKSCTSSGAACC